MITPNITLELFVLFSFIVSAAIGFIIVPRIVFISQKKGLFDFVNERKVHITPTPRLGGVSFFPAVIFSVSFVMALRTLFNLDIPPFLAESVLLEMPLLLCGLVTLYFIGMADDLVGVNFRYKLVAQLIASILLILSGIYVNNLHGFCGIYEIPTWFGYPLTVVLVSFIINAINLIDGIDGLASGLSSITLTSLGVWFGVHHLYIYSMIAFAMLGVIFPFFFYNVFGKNSKIFMGDTGSLLIGYLVAFLSAKLCMLSVSFEEYHLDNAPIIILAILFIPLFDAARVFFERIQKGKSPFHPDKTHIHHKFLALGFSHRQTMVFILAIATVIVVINYFLNMILNINIMFCVNITLGIIMTIIMHRVSINLNDIEEYPLDFKEDKLAPFLPKEEKEYKS